MVGMWEFTYRPRSCCALPAQRGPQAAPEETDRAACERCYGRACPLASLNPKIQHQVIASQPGTFSKDTRNAEVLAHVQLQYSRKRDDRRNGNGIKIRFFLS